MQGTPGPDEIFKRIFVESSEKGFSRLLERSPEHTGRLDAAISRFLEAFNNIEFLFGIANDGADVDLAGLSQQPKAAVLALHRFNVAKLAKLMHHLHEMAF